MNEFRFFDLGIGFIEHSVIGKFSNLTSQPQNNRKNKPNINRIKLQNI
jgi:hypothetical protein